MNERKQKSKKRTKVKEDIFSFLMTMNKFNGYDGSFRPNATTLNNIWMVAWKAGKEMEKKKIATGKNWCSLNCHCIHNKKETKDIYLFNQMSHEASGGLQRHNSLQFGSQIKITQIHLDNKRANDGINAAAEMKNPIYRQPKMSLCDVRVVCACALKNLF